MKLTIEQCTHLIELAELQTNWNYTDIKNIVSYKSVSFPIPTDIHEIVENYCKKKLNIELDNINLGVIKYEKGDKFARHIDHDKSKEFNKDFLYNINIRLNDNYVGGEFYLNDELFYKPMGEIYHYNSSTYHEVKEIKDGVRYLALFYIRYRDIKSTKII